MEVKVGWFDNKGKFHRVYFAVAGSFEALETGFGICSVKMRREDDPPDNIRALIEQREKAAGEPHKPTFYKAKGEKDAAVFCSCGWKSFISSFGFATDKAAKREAERRHAEHLKNEGRA